MINAGKSVLNEDQARCEVLVIKRKPGGNPTSSQIPMARRRSSLPNGEGLDLHASLVSRFSSDIRTFLLFVPEFYSIVGNDPVFRTEGPFNAAAAPISHWTNADKLLTEQQI